MFINVWKCLCFVNMFFYSSIGVNSATTEQYTFHHIGKLITSEYSGNRIRDSFYHCSRNTICKIVINKIESLLSIPPGTVVGIQNSIDRAGFSYEPPNGYLYCNVDAWMKNSRKSPSSYEVYIGVKADLMDVLIREDLPSEENDNVRLEFGITFVREDRYPENLQSGKCNVRRCWRVGIEMTDFGDSAFTPLGDSPTLVEKYGKMSTCPGRFY